MLSAASAVLPHNNHSLTATSGPHLGSPPTALPLICPTATQLPISFGPACLPSQAYCCITPIVNTTANTVCIEGLISNHQHMPTTNTPDSAKYYQDHFSDCSCDSDSGIEAEPQITLNPASYHAPNASIASPNIPKSHNNHCLIPLESLPILLEELIHLRSRLMHLENDQSQHNKHDIREARSNFRAFLGLLPVSAKEEILTYQYMPAADDCEGPVTGENVYITSELLAVAKLIILTSDISL